MKTVVFQPQNALEHERLCEYSGVLFIGDPHVEARQPGFRKDDYCQTILDKLTWIFDLAASENYLPVLLGDLFERPRDNPNGLIFKLLDLFQGQECLTLFGNHDCSEPQLTEDDSLSLLLKGSRLKLLTHSASDDGTLAAIRIQQHTVIIGGSSYRQKIPKAYVSPLETELVIWLTHHDIADDESAQRFGLRPRPIEGIDVVINGHIHRRLPEIQRGNTVWLNPGNISRRSRSELATQHTPAVLLLQFASETPEFSYIEVPHLPAVDVFHERVHDESDELALGESAFISGLQQLESIRTQSGAGLADFLQANAHQFNPDINNYIHELMQEVLENAEK